MAISLDERITIPLGQVMLLAGVAMGVAKSYGVLCYDRTDATQEKAYHTMNEYTKPRHIASMIGLGALSFAYGQCKRTERELNEL